MTYAIVYSSRTGNTKLLAETIRDYLSGEGCVYFGESNEKVPKAERVYVGFWTDKGSCDAQTAAFLKTLDCEEVYLFGTAGFGVSDAYYEQILQRVTKLLPPSVHVVGSFMCQGKMPETVRQKYEGLQKLPGMKTKMEQMIQNFDLALSHPDAQDLEHLKAAVLENA